MDSRVYSIAVNQQQASLLVELLEQAAVKVASARAFADLHEQAQAAVKALAPASAA